MQAGPTCPEVLSASKHPFHRPRHEPDRWLWPLARGLSDGGFLDEEPPVASNWSPHIPGCRRGKVLGNLSWLMLSVSGRWEELGWPTRRQSCSPILPEGLLLGSWGLRVHGQQYCGSPTGRALEVTDPHRAGQCPLLPSSKWILKLQVAFRGPKALTKQDSEAPVAQTEGNPRGRGQGLSTPPPARQPHPASAL